MKYQLKDEARRLYQQKNWHICEIEEKLDIKCTDYVIPQYMRTDREERERARKQRIVNNRNKIARETARLKRAAEVKERSRKLGKREIKAIEAITERHSSLPAFDMTKSLKNIKKCPANNWLMRSA